MQTRSPPGSSSYATPASRRRRRRPSPATNPAIVWYMANVHGREPSGGDAAIQILYELAARTDAEVTRTLDHLLVG